MNLEHEQSVGRWKRSLRVGTVSRVLRHGTIMVWDAKRKRAYPYYPKSNIEIARGDAVEFGTDESDTVVVKLERR